MTPENVYGTSKIEEKIPVKLLDGRLSEKQLKAKKFYRKGGGVKRSKSLVYLKTWRIKKRKKVKKYSSTSRHSRMFFVRL